MVKCRQCRVFANFLLSKIIATSSIALGSGGCAVMAVGAAWLQVVKCVWLQASGCLASWLHGFRLSSPASVAQVCIFPGLVRPPGGGLKM